MEVLYYKPAVDELTENKLFKSEFTSLKCLFHKFAQ
jgi:hypothetical protein